MSDDLDSFLSSLDVEVTKLTAKPRLEAEKKKLADKMRASGSTTDRGVLRQKIGELNQQIEALQWRTIASVALFQEQSCSSCQSVHRMFLQFMAKQETTSGAKCIRYLRTNRQDYRLPRETVVHRTKTTICASCAGDFDFDLSNALMKLGEITEPFAIAQGYEQVEEELEG